MTEQPRKKRTWQVTIKRVDTTIEPNKGVYIPILRDDSVIIEFQTDAGTIPTVTTKEVLDIEPTKPTTLQ